jgi:omega-6 fatty acid desaturase (delta-12 desaturase)
MPAPSSRLDAAPAADDVDPAAAGRRVGPSLNDVRAVIPPSCYERRNGPALWALGRAAALHLAALVGLALTDRWWLTIVLWLAAGLGVSGLFVLGHDASHGALLPGRRRNRLAARLCMIPSGHVEAAWDLGHNRIHHGYTARQGFDFVWHPVTAPEYAAMSRFRRLQHRFEWSWLGSGAYFLRTVWWQKMMRFEANEKRRPAIRRDKAFLWVGVAAAAAAAGAIGVVRHGWIGALWLPFELLVVPFLLFTQIIGWTVYVHHIHPEIRWWPRRQWDQFKGQMESTTILRFPRAINWLWFHNIFVHVPHHVDARIPFHKLPEAARHIIAAFPDVVRSAKFRVREYLRTTRACKLYDFEAGLWVRYPTRTRAA